jgi:hypothetical protein
MTGPATVNARTPGYDALMATLLGTATVQAATFKDRVVNRIQVRQDAAAVIRATTEPGRVQR